MNTAPPQQKIDIARLVPMDLFAGSAPLSVELAYDQPHNFCGIVIYRKGARLWLHEDLAAVTVLAAHLVHRRNSRVNIVLWDGLRTVAAQRIMEASPPVQANPHWLAGEDRVLAPPGRGAHPRGMAVDMGLETAGGFLLNMGAAFDEMPKGGTGPETNRAHRRYDRLPESVMENRALLDNAMTGAADRLGVPLILLSSEWWDFRLPLDVSNQYLPLDDPDLPRQMRMTDRHLDTPTPPDFPDSHFAALKTRIEDRIAPFLPQ